MIKKISLLLILGGFSFSCSDDDSSNTPLEKQNDIVTFGIRHDKKLSTYEAIAENKEPFNTRAYPDFSSVVAFSYTIDDISFVASGVLINKNWILSAAHNFTTKESGKVIEVKPKEVTVRIGNEFNNPTSTLSVDKIINHPVYLSSHKNSEEFDISLVKLSTPITSITPAKTSLNIENVLPKLLKKEVWIAGYGDYNPTAPDFSKVRKHAYTNVIDDSLSYNAKLSEESKNYNSVSLLMDFDSPDLNSNTLNNPEHFITKTLGLTRGSNAEPLDFEGIIVAGDSGGPIFTNIDGTWIVTAINAFENEITGEPGFKSSNYGAISSHITIHSHKTWINTVMNK